MKYCFEEDNQHYRDFYEITCKLYDKIKIVYYDDEDYMNPIERLIIT